MNKKMIAILVVVLFMGGVTSLLADESHRSTDNSRYDLTDPLPPELPTLSGIGNGGGNPG